MGGGQGRLAGRARVHRTAHRRPGTHLDAICFHRHSFRGRGIRLTSVADQPIGRRAIGPSAPVRARSPVVWGWQKTRTRPSRTRAWQRGCVWLRKLAARWRQSRLPALLIRLISGESLRPIAFRRPAHEVIVSGTPTRPKRQTRCSSMTVHRSAGRVHMASLHA